MKKRFIKVFAFVLILSVLLSSSVAFADTGSSTLSGAKSAVVRVLAEFGDGSLGFGSAFGVGPADSAPEYFVTNAHVCLNSETLKIADKLYILLDSKAIEMQRHPLGYNVIVDIDYSKVIACEVVNDDSIEMYPDIAVIKAEKPVEGRTTLPLRSSSDDLDDAENVYALGYPADMDVITLSSNDASLHAVAGIEDVTLTSGILSKKTKGELFENTNVLIHSAPFSGGNSGGPLIDSNGAVVGINTYSLTQNDNQYVSIYIDYAREILDENEIEYVTYGENGIAKTIILVAIMATVAVVAVLLVIKFKGKEKSYVRQKKQEAFEEANALRIQGVTGSFAGRRFPLDGQLSMGRDPSNNIVFPTDTKGVSANHCVIMRNGHQLYVKDLGSTYGTFINGTARAAANQLVSINVGDKISLGSELQTFIITRKGGKI